jgi:hypothetical protein
MRSPAGLVARGRPMMSARERKARRPDVSNERFRDDMRAAGFVPTPARKRAMGEWIHPDTGDRRYVWWPIDGTNWTFGRLIDELDAGRRWCRTGQP